MAVMDIVQDYWVLFVIGIILLVVVQMVFRAMFKVALVAVIIGFVAIFVFGQTPGDVLDTGKQVVNAANEAFIDSVKNVVAKEIQAADYQFNPDGTYEVKTKNLRIVGKQGDPDATVYYGDLHYTVSLSDLGDIVQQAIQQHQQ